MEATYTNLSKLCILPWQHIPAGQSDVVKNIQPRFMVPRRHEPPQRGATNNWKKEKPAAQPGPTPRARNRWRPVKQPDKPHAATCASRCSTVAIHLLTPRRGNHMNVCHSQTQGPAIGTQRDPTTIPRTGGWHTSMQTHPTGKGEQPTGILRFLNRMRLLLTPC